jgi:hypothetical protein
MTIPKHAGPSRLAEAASPIDYYPVKRRGQKRRLTPNWDAIRWLEDESEGDTEICGEAPRGAPGSEWGDVNVIRALGYYVAKRQGMYPRQMFDVFELEQSSSSMISYPDPCPACLDYSRTWACAEHHEIEWDTSRRCWVRPGTSLWYELHPMDTADLQAEEAVQPQGMQPPEGLYDRLASLPTGSITVNLDNTNAIYTLRVSGETDQGLADFTIEVEGDRRD